jgi:hypothetical protein
MNRFAIIPMATFEGDNMSIMKMPDIIDGQKRIVFVTHDETCFDSHDGKKIIWMDQDCTSLHPKSGGHSIMVLEFVCECHGPMKLSDVQKKSHPDVPSEMVRVIKPGKNADGYWTNEDLVQQLEIRAIPISEILHYAIRV